MISRMGQKLREGSVENDEELWAASVHKEVRIKRLDKTSAASHAKMVTRMRVD